MTRSKKDTLSSASYQSSQCGAQLYHTVPMKTTENNRRRERLKVNRRKYNPGLRTAYLTVLVLEGVPSDRESASSMREKREKIQVVMKSKGWRATG